MSTQQRADASLLNFNVKDHIVCQGTITTKKIEAIDADFRSLRVRVSALLPSGTFPVPPPPPPPSGDLMVEGDLTVNGSSTLNTLNVTGDSKLTNLDLSGTLNVSGTSTLATTTVNNDLTVVGTPFMGMPTTSTHIVYVNKGGSDTKGDGRLFTPFLTIQKAMTSITDASQTKQYAVILGPGIFDEDFAFKPWVSLSGEPSTSAFQGVSTIGTATITFDLSWLGITYDVAWFTHLTFNNVVPFDIQNVNAQLTFFDCTFNAGASYTGHNSGNVNNITWDTCLSYGAVSVTNCQFFFLIGGTSILGASPVTITATNAVGAGTPTQLLALGCSISPGVALVSGVGSGGASGDMRGCGVQSTLSLNSTGGAPISYTATVEGFPQTISFAGTASVTNLHYYTFSNALAYTPSTLANWSGTSPVNVQNALDRIAAKITPVP